MSVPPPTPAGEITYVIGHKNPDADSICSAIAYAAFKEATGCHGHVAARCGNSNARIDAILARFHQPLPVYLSDVTPRVRDLMVSNVTGNFEKHTGVVEIDDKDISKSRVNVAIETNSINTHQQKRDEHLRSADFENLNLPDWTMLYPDKNPLRAIQLRIPTADDGAQGKPVTWKERGIATQNIAWVPPQESLQWNSTKSLIELLRSRDNRVYVILGPFNPYVLTKESRARYAAMKQEMQRQLQAMQVGCFTAPDLPSAYYADASHPLKEGYREMAQKLCEAKSFQAWLNPAGGGAE